MILRRQAYQRPPGALINDAIVGLERIEQEAWAQLAACAPASFAETVALETCRVGGAYFHMARHIPAFQFNWLGGAGLDPWERDAVPSAVARFREAGQQKFIVQVPPTAHTDEVEQQARSAGLAPHALAWAKFRRDTGAVPPVPTDLEIREIDATQAVVFAATTTAGFGMPQTLAAWLREIVGRPGWHCYVSYAGVEAAGAGALFVREDHAWIGIGATRPGLRRRGGHRALLARRLADAARYGARIVVTETGVPQGAQPAPSYRNIVSLGFSVAYVRANWALPA